MRRVKVFTDRFPFLGPAIWMLTVEYFAVQIVAASAWHQPPYSWRFNTISDLGNTVCGALGSRNVCSPLHSLMNAAFIALGLLMACGALLIYQEFKESRASLVGFCMLAVAGFGTILVGIFPENTVATLHLIGAGLPFLIGNVGLVVLAIALNRLPAALRLYGLISGLLPLIVLGFFITAHYGALGIGGTERLVAYPQTFWLIVFGLYMTRNHIKN